MVVVISLPWPRSTLVERTPTAIPTHKTINSGEYLGLGYIETITAYVPSEHRQNTSYIFLMKIYNVYFQQIYTISNSQLHNLNISY
jgi:hypothetical protein